MSDPILFSAALDATAVQEAAASVGRAAEAVADDLAALSRMTGAGAFVVDAAFPRIEGLARRMHEQDRSRDVVVIGVLPSPEPDAVKQFAAWGVDDVCLARRLRTDLAARLRAAIAPVPGGGAISPRRPCLYVDGSGVRQAVYARLLDRAGFQATGVRKVEDAIFELEKTEVVVADASLADVARLPAAAPEIPIVALVAPGAQAPAGGFRFGYERTRAPEELIFLLNELLFGPELAWAPSQRRTATEPVRLGDGEDAVWGITHNVNPTGLAFRTLAIVPVGTTTTVTMRVPADGEEIEEITVPVKVVWRMPLTPFAGRAHPPALGLLFQERMPVSLRRFYQTLPKPAPVGVSARLRVITPPPRDVS